MDDIVIAAGEQFTDIDVLACAESYKELLESSGIKTRIILPGPFNKSITKKIEKWPLKYEKIPGDISKSSFVIVDISEPMHIASFVDQDRIVRLFDHHFGFEEYWHNKYKNKATIEKVGACATLIWEEYVKLKKDKNITTLSANLISTAIISNSLNFKASVTSERDIRAYKQLKKYANLSKNWVEEYFHDQEVYALNNPYQAVKEDTKLFVTKLPYKLTIGQLELWDSKKFFNKFLLEAKKAIQSFGNNYWFLTSPSISEGRNYIYATNPEITKLLTKILDVEFKNNIAITKKLFLRKEIKRMLMDIK